MPDEPRPPLRARVLNMHARASSDRRRDDDAARWASKAISLARDLGLADVLADATTTLARLDERAGDPDSSRATSRRPCRRRGRPARWPPSCAACSASAASPTSAATSTRRWPATRQRPRRARETGRPWAPYGLDARIMVAIVAHVAGDWDLVERTVDVTGESPPGMSEAALAAAGPCRRGRPRRAVRARRCCRRCGRGGSATAWSASSPAPPRSTCYGDAGDLDAATAIYDDVVAAVAAVWQQP